MREVDLTVFAAEFANGAFAIDVPEPDEYRAGHVPGSHPAPVSTLGAVVRPLPGDRTASVICASGSRRATGHVEALGADAVPVAGGTAAGARAGHSLDHGAAAAESA
ncbi:MULTISPECIES: rhodanese-like domain-containing protein [unclassified Streptomyces]|uniref:rhodanese-like domain-containing protein n=1 Tax=unclassified Streptomyces TaxID=2593676 RepID=UPI0035DE9964